MKRWITKVIQEDSRDSVSKAREDVITLGHTMGYETTYIYRYQDANEDHYALHSRIDGITAGILPGDLLVYQYPSYNGIQFDRLFLTRMAHRGIIVSLFVHDIEYLRGAVDQADEVAVFQSVHSMIIHGQAMKEALRSSGVTVPLIQKEFFDYLHTGITVGSVKQSEIKQLVIAGNLNKSSFLNEWPYPLPIMAFGDTDQRIHSSSVQHMGSFSPNELIQKIPQNSLGLAWDTDLDHGGAYQQYTKYNSPHKISLYLSLGIPVVVWDQSGIAPIIKQKNVGITIATLDELPKIWETLSSDQMIQMKQNAITLSRQLTHGMFTRKSLLAAEMIALDYSTRGDL